MSLLGVGNERRSGVMAARGLPGLDWLNFFVANFQTGFGPFISVYLTNVGWTQGAIGAALTARAHDEGDTEQFGDIVVPKPRVSAGGG